MNRFIAALACTAALSASAATFENPVLAGDYPDPAVIRVGKEYWATATSSEWAPQFPLMRSTDLVNWEIAGTVFDEPPAWSVANYWAPEIVEYKGRYFIYYVARRQGGPLSVAVATADKPQGPYKDHGILVSQPAGSIDAIPFTDEKGDRYLIWKEDGNSRRLPTIIWAQPLSEDGTKLSGEMRELFRNDVPWEGAVVEGPFVVKHGEWFYIFYSGNACCGRECHYGLGVARSKSLLGPYEKNPNNPILPENRDWRCPGHGSIVTDPSGRYWLMYHAYDANSFTQTGREALLDEVIFGADGWPTINQGRGPSSVAEAPHRSLQKKKELRFRDDFNNRQMTPGWNWPVGDARPASFKKGQLILKGNAAHGNNLLGGVFGRSITGGDFQITTIVDRESLEGSENAGLAMIGDRAHATGIALVGGEIIAWSRLRNEQRTLAAAPAPKSKKLHLQIIGSNGRQYIFSFSSDGENWTDLPVQASGNDLPPWDRALRAAVTVGGAPGAEARFDLFSMNASRSLK